MVAPLARGNIHGKIHRDDKINDFRGLAELLLSVGGKKVNGIIHLQWKRNIIHILLLEQSWLKYVLTINFQKDFIF